MARRGLRVWGFTCLIAASIALVGSRGHAANLDEDGEITMGLRTYVNARVGTEDTDSATEFGLPVIEGTDNAAGGGPGVTRVSRTFPYSSAGHLRQNRFFLEVEWKHDLRRLQKEGFGPLTLLNQLPFRVRNLRYGLTFRAEGDGLYDWGPSEFRTAEQWVECQGANRTGCLTNNPATRNADLFGPLNVDVPRLRQRLRKLGVHRERLFQAYIEADIGSNLWFRFGRQILSWGETDAFRLLDNINPIDPSFGGFLVPLDERRVPLDMLRMTYRTGTFGPMYDTYFEVYGAVDDKASNQPGTAAGSPWALPNTGVPSASTLSVRETPDRNFSDMRGGGRFVFNIGDGTFSLAHYYTYMDIPAVQTFIRPLFPNIAPNLSGSPETWERFAFLDEGGLPRYSVKAVQRVPLTQITGATMTFALPDLYSVLRAEFAYFHDEARFTQAQLDPFIYHFYNQNPTTGDFEAVAPVALSQACRSVSQGTGTPEQVATCKLTGGRRLGDSMKTVIGWDSNQFIRWLNPHQSFFISTQFFYQRLLGAAPRRSIDGRLVDDGEVLPVTEYDVYAAGAPVNTLGAVEPVLIRQPTNTFLHTLLITTSYRSGTVVPSFTFFYDWGGATVFVPAIQFIQDPFRFGIDYSILSAGRLKGGSGVSLVRDRDTIQFRLEYVI